MARLRYEDLKATADGLYTPEVGPWADEKYRHVWNYADMFASSMKRKWDKRAYINLFSGAGLARVENTERYLFSSSLLALKINTPFDKYVFCDADPRCIETLRMRVDNSHPEADVEFVEGDVNRKTSEILDALPSYGPKRKVLSFCFVDPWALSNLFFSTIDSLATRFMDFLVLIPTGEIPRNQTRYLSKGCEIIDNYLGTHEWREDWAPAAGIPFERFVANYYCNQMRKLGYEYGELEDSIQVRSEEKNLPLYLLGFFSRSPLGNEFWKQAKKYSTPQLKLFE